MAVAVACSTLHNVKRTVLINDFAQRSLRDLGDEDYICARTAHKHRLGFQFRWCGLQAIEKYLKAILLFNGSSAKGLGHDLDAALTRVRDIHGLEFEIPEDVEEFVRYLHAFGEDRYFSYSTYVPHRALTSLDRSVWYVRRFCFYMGGSHPDGRPLLPNYVERAKSQWAVENPHKYKISGGFLEKVVADRLFPYEALVWKNFFYGRIAKPELVTMFDWSTGMNPTHVMHSEAFAILDEVIGFPKAARRRLGVCEKRKSSNGKERTGRKTS